MNLHIQHNPYQNSKAIFLQTLTEKYSALYQKQANEQSHLKQFCTINEFPEVSPSQI